MVQQFVANNKIEEREEMGEQKPTRPQYQIFVSSDE